MNQIADVKPSILAPVKFRSEIADVNLHCAFKNALTNCLNEHLVPRPGYDCYCFRFNNFKNYF